MALRDKLRILVVDDMSTSRGLIVQSLESFGVRFISNSTGAREALSLLEISPVHLVISDYNMPDMNGLQLLQSLRTNPKTQKAGFILITGRAERGIIESGRKLGMNNFLKKPFQPAELRECIEAVVGRL